jgi:hypothetical protein
MGFSSWDVLRKAPEIAELVDDWRLDTLREDVSYVLSGTTKHAGFWGFSITRYDAGEGAGSNWTYEGTVATGELMLRLPPEVAQQIFDHAEQRLNRTS